MVTAREITCQFTSSSWEENMTLSFLGLSIKMWVISTTILMFLDSKFLKSPSPLCSRQVRILWYCTSWSYGPAFAIRELLSSQNVPVPWKKFQSPLKWNNSRKNYSDFLKFLLQSDISFGDHVTRKRKKGSGKWRMTHAHCFQIYVFY